MPGTVVYNSTMEYDFTSPKPCLAEKDWFAIGFMPFDIIAICLNMALLAASLVDKEKLQRRNYTLASVNSALLSHTIYLALKIWAASASTTAKDSDYVLGEPKVMWTACEAGLTAIGFAVVANASSLIYVTLDSTIVWSRSQAQKQQPTEGDKSQLPQKRNIAIVLMAVSWIVPVTFIVVATLVWNCAEDCWCPSSAFRGEVCPHEYRCSRLVKPLPTLFLVINAGLWCLEIITLIAMIVKKYIEFKNSAKVVRTDQLPESEVNSARSVPGGEVMNNETNRNSHQRTKTSNVNLAPKFNSRFRMAVTLTVLLIVCFVPSAVSIVIDAMNPNANLMPASIMSTICLYSYMLAFPFVILQYLPNLKDSLGMLIGKICSPC